jgi:hypothetical protein
MNIREHDITALYVSSDTMYNLPPVRYDGFIERDIIIPRFFLKLSDVSYQGLSYIAFVKLSLCNNSNSYCQISQDRSYSIYFTSLLQLICAQKCENWLPASTRDSHFIYMKATESAIIHYHFTNSYFHNYLLLWTPPPTTTILLLHVSAFLCV